MPFDEIAFLAIRTMKQESIDDPRSGWMIRMRLMRLDLEDPSLSDDQHDRLQQQFDKLIDVPIELRHRDRVEELTEVQLIRLSHRHEPEENLDPLPEFIEWPNDKEHPTDDAFVMVLWYIAWDENGQSERRGSIQVSNGGSEGTRVELERAELPWYEVLTCAVEKAWSRGLDRIYRAKLPARRV